MLADFHVHSAFSDDSVTPMEAQLDQALARGLTGLCFTDHVDYGIKKDWAEGDIQYRQGEPLANVDYPAYFAELSRLEERYAGRIALFRGLEFGMQRHTVPQFQSLYAKYWNKLDFVLLSCHQVEEQEFWTGDFMRGRAQSEYNARYYGEIYAVMERYQDYSVLAHLDLLARYDPAGPYPFDRIREQVAEILRLAIRRGKGIELNTSSWRYGLSDTQPSREILRLYKDLGGEIVTLGSDAHTPDYAGDHFRDALHILHDEIGFERIFTFEHMQPIGWKICDLL